MRELWGTGVFHCTYCHGYEVAGRRLAVFRTGPLAVHQALLLRDWSEDVTVLTSGAGALPEEEREELRAHGIKIEETPVAALVGERGKLAAVAFQDGRRLPFGGLFTAPRVTLASPLAQQLGCELEEGPQGPWIKTDNFKESTVTGMYAAGDAARPMHSITFASADGVMAGIAAHRSLLFPKPAP